MRVPLVYKDIPGFGFDIGTHNVKVVQLKKIGHKTIVQGYGSCFFPRDAMAEGIVVDPVEMAKAIKPMLQKLTYGKLTSKRIIAGLPAAKLFTRTLQLPRMNDADLNQAIRFEVEQYVPVPVNDLYIDYEIVGTNTVGKEPTIDVLMMAAPRAIVDSYIRLFDALGLEISAIEANMTAVIRGLIHSGDAGGSTLAMDIGSISSDITIYDRFIPLAGSVPVGGEQYTEALMQKLGVKIDQANEMKVKFGIGPSDLHDSIYSAIEPHLQTAAKEATRIIKFYERRTPDQQPKSVKSMVISGGTAQMPGIADYFREQVKLPLIVANPWKNLEIKNPPATNQSDAPMYTTAIGLALRGIL